MNFFLKLINSRNDVSSKRFVGLISFLTIVIISFINLFCGLTLQPYMFNGLLWMSFGALGLTSIEKFNNKENE